MYPENAGIFLSHEPVSKLKHSACIKEESKVLGNEISPPLYSETDLSSQYHHAILTQKFKTEVLHLKVIFGIFYVKNHSNVQKYSGISCHRMNRVLGAIFDSVWQVKKTDTELIISPRIKCTSLILMLDGTFIIYKFLLSRSEEVWIFYFQTCLW